MTSGAFSGRTLSKGLAVGLMVVGLSGCAALHDMDGWLGNSGLQDKTPNADLAFGALARNDLQAAEEYVDKALRQNAKDPYALLAAGILYQNTGRPSRARVVYQDLLALNSPINANVQSWSRLEPQSVADIAAANLQVLDITQGGGWPRNDLAGPNDMGGTGMMSTGGAMSPVPAQPMPGTMSGTSMSAMQPGGMQTGGMQSGMVDSSASSSFVDEGDRNVVHRFEILRELENQGLITEEEYRQRRQANLGGLVPLSAPEPAAGLERPVPEGAQVIQRLQALRRAFEMRAISAREHAVERTMILDALLPAQPQVLAPPVAPPEGIMAAAAAVGRLERLRQAGLLTSDEAAKERAAIEQAIRANGGSPGTVPPLGEEFGPAEGSGPQPLVQGGTARPAAPTADPSLFENGNGGAAPAATSGYGVHVASYRTQAAADQGAAELQRKFGALKGLPHSVAKVNIKGKGTYYRLMFGPAADQAAAESLCATLKRNGQYCKTQYMGG